VLVDKFIRHGLERFLGIDDLAGRFFHLLGGCGDFFRCRDRGYCLDSRCGRDGCGRGDGGLGGKNIFRSHDDLSGRFLPGLFELPEEISEFGCISDSHRAFPPVCFQGWQPDLSGKLPKYWEESGKSFRREQERKEKRNFCGIRICQ